MSAAKHTPGPWEAKEIYGWGDDICVCPIGAARPIFKSVKPETYYTDYPVGSGGSRIISTALALKQGNYVATEEIKAAIRAEEAANACLIATAPDLLEFAEEVRRTGDTRLASMAIALIAKATGGEA